MVAVGAGVPTWLDLWSDSVWQLFNSYHAYSFVSLDAIDYDLGVKRVQDSLCLALVKRFICLNRSLLSSS